jgi:hypothetical protein
MKILLSIVSLKPLLPTYVSTVDSGNLAGHLLTLRPGLLDLPDQKILETRFFDGLRDTLMVLEDAAGEASSAQLAQFQTYLETVYESRPTTLTAAWLCLDQLSRSAEEVLASLKAAPEGPATWWARALAGHYEIVVLDKGPGVVHEVVPCLLPGAAEQDRGPARAGRSRPL